MSSRRAFLGQVATSLGGLASVPRNVLGANDRIRLGIIGYGDRGSAIAREAAACPNTQFVAVTDIYTKQLERAKAELAGVKTFMDHRQMLDDQSIDAVLIATPQHLHCLHFVDSIKAGKHVYQEKTMAFTVDHARRMRAAYAPAKAKQTVQIGHQSCSFGQVSDAFQFLSGNRMGQITAIDAAMYRNTPHGKPQWSRPVYPDMTAENILWNKFLGEAAPVPFDARPLPQLAFLLGLFRRECLREHVPPGFVLVQGARATDSQRCHDDRRPLPVARRTRSTRYHDCFDGAA